MSSSRKENMSYYSIGAVSRLTGITVHTLRVWEQRYSAIEAERTISGRRKYTSHNVDRLMSLKFLVDRGCQISSIATLSENDQMQDAEHENLFWRQLIAACFAHFQKPWKDSSH